MQIKPKIETFARIKVLGVGGSGTNAVHRMTQLGINGVEFISINTDAQALHNSQADKKVHIGKTVTRGLGAGMNPDRGRDAAEESKSEISDAIEHADMVFITCGLGGGTASGAAPVIAELAKNSGILTVAVVTKPFSFEGTKRSEIAEEAYSVLKDKVDAIISIANDRILQIIDKKTSLIDAFKTVDEVLRQGIQGISDLITTHGIVNADFADVRTITQDAGTALMGIGLGSGENRAVDAARNAINSPLLELAVDGAKGVLFNITGGPDLSMMEIDEAAKIITKSVDPEAKIKFGAVIDDAMKDAIKITVIATGFDETQRKPSSIRPIELDDAAATGSGFGSNIANIFGGGFNRDFGRSAGTGSALGSGSSSGSSSSFGPANAGSMSRVKKMDDLHHEEFKRGDLDLRPEQFISKSESQKNAFGSSSFGKLDANDASESQNSQPLPDAMPRNRKPFFGSTKSDFGEGQGSGAGSDEDIDVPAFLRKKMK